jgi:5-methylcytosine-specific restriction endonuclease McrA
VKQKQKIREQFREAVFKRDGHKCRVCGRKDVKLDAHHITDRNEIPNGGYVKENGITLCDTERGCHWKAEIYHQSGGEDWLTGFHPADLYKLIGSSKEKAIAAAHKL